MPSYLRKERSDILRQALRKMQRDTPITSVGPGSIARALVETCTTEIGDMYDLMDYNLNQQFVSTASGQALDALGSLYNVVRKQTSNLVSIDKAYGAFYFYIASEYGSDIVIPRGTNIYTDSSTFIGQQFSYSTNEDTLIPAGRLRAFATITPNFTDSVFTSGANTLIMHDFSSPAGTTVLCTNPKIIQSQIGYEDDESYRFRIIKGIRVASAGTAEAVRFSGLTVPGVRDVRIRQAPYGLGSYEIVVIPEDFNSSGTIVNQVSQAIDAVRPLGVRAFIKAPETKTVDLTIQLVIPSVDGTRLADGSTQKARIAAMRYIASLLPGDKLYYNKLVQNIMDSTDSIRDIIITRYAIAGAEASRTNFQPDADQQLIPGTVDVTIASS